MSDPSEMALIRIAAALEAFRDEFTTPVIDQETGEFLQGSLAERLVDLLENPMTVVNNSAPASVESDDLDPTFAALAGACYSMSDQLEKVLNEPDQFKKAQGLRNLVTQMRSLADKYAENAATLDYQHAMQSRIRRVESDDGEETPEGETGIRFAVQEPYEETQAQGSTEPESGSGKYRPQKVWQEAHGKTQRKGPKAKE